MRQFSILLLTINIFYSYPLFGYENDCLRPYLTEAEIYLNSLNPNYSKAITTYEEALKSCSLSNNDKVEIITKLNAVHATVKENLLAETAKSKAALEDAEKAKVLAEERRLKAEKAEAASAKQALISEAGRLALLADEEQLDLQRKLVLAFDAMQKIDAAKETQPEILRVFGDAVRDALVLKKAALDEPVNDAILIGNNLVFTKQNELIFQQQNQLIKANQVGKGIFELEVFGKQLVSYDNTNTIKFWNEMGELLKQNPAHDAPINFMTVGASNKLMLSGGRDQQAIIWNQQGEKVAVLPHQASVLAGGIYKADELVFTRSSDKKVTIWNLDGQEVKALLHKSYVYDAKLMGNYLVTAEANGNINIWDDTGKSIKQIESDAAAIKIIVSPDKQYFVTIYGGGQMALRNQEGMEVFTKKSIEWGINQSTNGKPLGIENALFLPQSKQLLIQSGAQLKILDLKGEVVADFQHDAAVNEIKLSPDGVSLLTTSQDRTAKLWNTKGQILLNLDQFKGQVIDGYFSSNGEMLIAYDKYGEIQICPVPAAKYLDMLDNQPTWMIEKRAKYGLRE